MPDSLIFSGSSTPDSLIFSGLSMLDSLIFRDSTCVYAKNVIIYTRNEKRISIFATKVRCSKAKSLRILIDSDHYPDITWGIKLFKGNVGFANGVLTLPQWTAFLLKRLMASGLE